MATAIDRLQSVDAILGLYPEASPAQRRRIRRDVESDLQEAEAGRRLVLGAWQADWVVGTVQLVWSNAELAEGRQTALIHHARVHPDYRRRGIGTALMDIAEAEARNQGFAVLTLGVEPSNEAAIRFYTRRGFERTHKYSGETGELLQAMKKPIA
ncbi:MAG: GNAT family N-acetyltransferase [Salinibacter sp.]